MWKWICPLAAHSSDKKNCILSKVKLVAVIDESSQIIIVEENISSSLSYQLSNWFENNS